MSTDTIDLKPTFQKIESDILDRPARKLINGGAAAMAVGLAAAVMLSSYAAGDHDWIHIREGFTPLFYCVAIIGGVFIAGGVIVRVVNSGHEQTRKEGRERTRKDMTEVVTSAEVERVRREHRLLDAMEEQTISFRTVEARQAGTEQRLDQLERRFDFQLNKVVAAVVKIGDQMERLERDAKTEAEAKKADNVRWQKTILDGVFVLSENQENLYKLVDSVHKRLAERQGEPVDPKYLVDMSEAVRLGEELERRRRQLPEQGAN